MRLTVKHFYSQRQDHQQLNKAISSFASSTLPVPTLLHPLHAKEMPRRRGGGGFGGGRRRAAPKPKAQQRRAASTRAAPPPARRAAAPAPAQQSGGGGMMSGLGVSGVAGACAPGSSPSSHFLLGPSPPPPLVLGHGGPGHGLRYWVCDRPPGGWSRDWGDERPRRPRR